MRGEGEAKMPRAVRGSGQHDILLARDLSNIQPLLDNTGLGKPVPMTFWPRLVRLRATNVSCTDVAALKVKGVEVDSDCR